MLSPISHREHEARWNRPRPLVQEGDEILTFDTKSLISRVITHSDQGSWSRAVIYVGDGRIVEAVGEGVVERSIETYRYPRYRLGVYRMPSAKPQQLHAIIDFVRSNVGDGYSYRKVLLIGLRLALGMWPTAVPRHTTPNMLAIKLGCNLVGIA
jgi:uncharacterized protein YycO